MACLAEGHIRCLYNDCCLGLFIQSRHLDEKKADLSFFPMFRAFMLSAGYADLLCHQKNSHSLAFGL
jgi:hypothetical protein